MRRLTSLIFLSALCLTLVLPLIASAASEADCGQLIERAAGKAKVWWCEAAWKISRDRALPKATASAAELSAAKNEFEAVQIVIQPTEKLEGLTVSPGPLTGPDGAMILAEQIQVLRVHYHFVEHPTAKAAAKTFWPDALPPLRKPIDVAAGQNQPLWVLVHVSKETPAGDYQGSVKLHAAGWSADVPIRLHVWNFELPERNHLETSFGMMDDYIYLYHQLKTEADKRRVLDLYHQSFADHRISPTNPTPLDPIRVKFLPQANPPRAEIDFTDFDRAMEKAVRQFHFTNFVLKVEGMGSGTFYERKPPQIENFAEKTPQYQAMFESQVKQIESHLREKGWLEMAYVYWFDEPAPEDYEFVRQGMMRLKKYAPGLSRMLTEEPGNETLSGAVDIWCPGSASYEQEAAEKRRAAGDRFWWYLCTAPKPPYCTLFLDRPAAELRVWFWQTWQRKIVGTLVWQTNYWTSPEAFPDTPQNPYEDPMSYMTSYGTARGQKIFWGNGDGRFLYPPERAATPGLSGPDPVIEPPVSSIRWEMLRDGIEDYEYLYRLRELLKERRNRLSAERVQQLETLLEVPADISSDMTHFTLEPAPINARRAAIAEAIEKELSQKL